MMIDSPMDFICRCLPDGTVSVQMPNPHYPLEAPATIYEHVDSDARFGPPWGYGGAGPANLALNVMAAFLPGDDGEVARDGTKLSRSARDAHHDFKDKFLRTMPKNGGIVRDEEIRTWLRARGDCVPTSICPFKEGR